ncbi:hypothetical protein F5Y16DRAFT_423148 [Xylariaceae sp. FL0255]|nr:hypothetical protein F5Y16DRAFT_423148 [Xylariaceae sp. FL0255]
MFRLGVLKQDQEQDGDARETPVVVEEMAIDSKYAKPEYSDRLFKRLVNVLSFGQSYSNTVKGFRALHCRGIYFDTDNEIIGLAYEYPSRKSKTVDYEKNVIVGVDNRIRLARDLVLAVSNLQHTGWMHKNISRVDLSAPAPAGFSHSRQRDEAPMPSKHYGTSAELRSYHHPDYAGKSTGRREPYRAEFDYYSFGLVLLKLGYWWPLRKIVGNQPDRSP